MYARLFVRYFSKKLFLIFLKASPLTLTGKSVVTSTDSTALPGLLSIPNNYCINACDPEHSRPSTEINLLLKTIFFTHRILKPLF